MFPQRPFLPVAHRRKNNQTSSPRASALAQLSQNLCAWPWSLPKLRPCHLCPAANQAESIFIPRRIQTDSSSEFFSHSRSQLCRNPHSCGIRVGIHSPFPPYCGPAILADVLGPSGFAPRSVLRITLQLSCSSSQGTFKNPNTLTGIQQKL